MRLSKNIQNKENPVSGKVPLQGKVVFRDGGASHEGALLNALTAIDESGSYRIFLADTTSMCREAVEIHGTGRVASAALGRVLTAAGLMGLMKKDEESKLTIQIKGDGPAGEILATAYGNVHVKGYISDPSADAPSIQEGKLNVGGIVGRGTLTVIRDMGLKEPYVGKTDLVSGEIAEDLTAYFAISEQQPSSVALGVFVGSDGGVEQAGGFIIQILPFPAEGAVSALEKLVESMPPITTLLGEVSDTKELLTAIFKDIPEEYAPKVLEERSISWKCDCSRERMEKALISIGESDLREICEKDGEAEIVCQFCRKGYNFEKNDLEALAREAAGPAAVRSLAARKSEFID